MDGYAPAYVAHNIPLLVVSGLGIPIPDHSELKGGLRIVSEIPSVDTDDALALLKHFENGDAAGLAWNAQEHSGRNKFKVKIVGRVVKHQSIILFITEAQ